MLKKFLKDYEQSGVEKMLINFRTSLFFKIRAVKICRKNNYITIV